MQSTQLTKTIFDNSPVAIYTCDSQGFITSFNKAAEILWGRTPEIGKDKWSGAWKVYNSEGEPIPLDSYPLAKTLNEGKASAIDNIIIERPDGTKAIVKPYPVPVFEDGVLSGGINTLIDVSKLFEGEEKQAMLAAIVNTSDDAIISKTLKGIITSWNIAAEKLFGYTAAEAIGKHISMIIPEERLSEEELIISNIAKGNKVDHFETIRLRKDKTEIPISLSISPVMDSSGKIIGASKIARDMSDKRNADEKQAILASIIDTSDDTILSKTLKGIITSWNKSAERMFGYTEQEAIGKHISLLIPPTRLSEEDYIIGQIAKGNKVDHFETIRVTKSGREIPISLTVSPIKDSKGNVIGASKIARDISAQFEAKKAALKYTERLEIINAVIQTVSEELDLERILQKITDTTSGLTGAKFGAFFYNQVNADSESHMLYCLSGISKEAFEKFGIPRNSEVFHSTFSGEGVVRVDDITKDPRYGKNPSHSGLPIGHLPVVSYLAVPVISRSGDVLGGLFFGHPEPGRFTDEHESLITSIAAQTAIGIDNAKLYEQVKILNDKKDEFIGLASHELKTPLTSISGYLQILSRFMNDEKSQKFVDKTLQQVNKLTMLVNDLLDVSKIEAGKLELARHPFNIRGTVDNAIELIQHSNANYTITLNTTVDKLIVYADANRIEQVLINLLNNGIKYSPDADQLEVILEHDADEVKIGIKDFGIGIASDKLKQIFSRFYRVEDINPNISGLGIGLYISNEIVSRHNGKIWVESELGKGSTFWFTIPINLP